jgi:hypothetical protein
VARSLSIAKVKLPGANAAVGLGEVFNYLRSAREMRRAFKNVYRALQPGGVLIFDTKEPLPGPGTKRRNAARWGKDWAILVDVTEDPRRKRLTRKIVAFRRAGKRYRRSEEVHRQIILPAKEVARLLQAAAFRVRLAQGYGSYTLPADRRVVIATKP